MITTYLVLDAVTPDGVGAGFALIVERAADHFDMVIQSGSTFIPDGSGGEKDAYIDLPGLAVVIGAMWLTNLGYWGTNQYIIQKGKAGDSEILDIATQALEQEGVLLPPGVKGHVIPPPNQPV